MRLLSEILASVTKLYQLRNQEILVAKNTTELVVENRT